eukprot:15470358-Alexandrium_andersonii.AAC.1
MPSPDSKHHAAQQSTRVSCHCAAPATEGSQPSPSGQKVPCRHKQLQPMHPSLSLIHISEPTRLALI